MSDSLVAAAATTALVVGVAATGGAAAVPLIGAAASGGTAATAGLIGSAGAISLASTVQFGLTAAGVFGALEAGNAQASSLKQEAYQRDLQARASTINAKERANSIREQMFRDTAQANALLSARGADLSSGNARQAIIESQANAQRGVNQSIFQGNLETAQNQLAATQARRDASAARTSGYVTAATRGATLLDF